MIDDIVFISQITIKSSIGVLLAAIGEIFTERSGILNLGVEGMMLAGALTGAAIGLAGGPPLLALGGGMLAGGLLAMLHAFFSITLRANQTLSGLAIAILGGGLSNFLGRPIIGEVGIRLKAFALPYLSDIPVIGEIFFNQSVLVYLAYLIIPLASYVLFHTRTGLKIRAVGDDAVSADAIGINVTVIRYCCTVFGGILAGLGGCYLSLAYTPGWKENMTAGQGWIAIAMVIFSLWSPYRAVLGALLFGGLTALQFFFQATGIEIIPVYILLMLPYLLTIGVLILVMRLKKGGKDGRSPRCLGVPFHREG
jgi:simple sugar transport system permease protein